MTNKKVYFLSDAHLGMYPAGKSAEREKLLVKWLDEIKDQTEALYLVGDIFDFWYEYKHVVPRGHTRFLGKIAEFTDNNIPVYYFTGNHDVWSYGYLAEECGVKIITEPIQTEIYNKKFYIAHGDGLGPGDKGYMVLKWAFHNKFFQWAFSRLHPNLALGLGRLWSKRSRLAKGIFADFYGEKEWLIQHARSVLEKEKFDYFVFGHRHLAINLKLNKEASFIVLGDWIFHFTYAEFDGKEMKVIPYIKEKDVKVIDAIE